MLRTIIAGTAVAGALTLGLAGTAGAATTPAGAGNGGTGGIKAALCADLPQVQSTVQQVEATLTNTWIPALQGAETKAEQSGHTTLANRIATRISHLQQRESKVNARLQKLQGKCAASG